MPYNAFISYSHAADDKLAPAVQSALHRFAKPWYRLRALRVFRDKTSLSATPELWGGIERALSTAEYFVLLASPEAAQSQWVQKEVKWWLDNKPVEKLLIGLTAGQIRWKTGSKDFDWAQTTALPDGLQRAFEQEPLYVDLSWAKREVHLSLHDARFREAITMLSATIHGRAMDEMAGEDVRQHRRTRLVAFAAGVAIVAFGILAEVQRRFAVAERDSAVERLGQLHVNNGLKLAQEGDAFGAMSWFAEALRRDQNNSVRAHQYRVRFALYSRTVPRLLHSWVQQQPVTFADFSPDGRWIVTASGTSYPRKESAGEARVWDAVTGEPVSPPMRHAGTVYSACFSPDGTRVLTAGGDGSARIWDAKTGQLVVGGIKPGGVVRRARFSPDGRRVATAGRAVQVWDATTGEPVTAPLAIPDRSAWHVEFSPDGAKLLATYGNGYLENSALARIWDPASGEPLTPVIERGGTWVYSGAFSPDGTRFVLADRAGEAQVFATATGEPVGSAIKHAGSVAYAAFSGDGLRVITAGWDGKLHIRNVHTRTPEKTLELPAGEQIRQAALSPDGRLLITGSSGGTGRVWDTYTGKALSPALRLCQADYPRPNLFEPGETPGSEFAVGFAPDGHRVVTAGWDGTVRIWDLASSAATSISLPEPQTLPPQMPAAPPRLSVERRESAVVVTESASRRQLTLPMAVAARTAEEKARETIRAVYSADGKWLAIANTSTLTAGWLFVADTAGFRPRELTALPGLPMADIAFDPHRERIVVNFESDFGIKGHSIYDADVSDVVAGYVRAWDLRSLQPATPPFERSGAVRALQFDATGERLAGTLGGEFRVWDAGSGKLLSAATAHEKAINALAFSPDGKYVATASEDATARVWDAKTGEPVTAPLSHDPVVNWLTGQGVVAIAFSADSTQLATAGTDQFVRLWNVRTGQPQGPPLAVTFPVQRLLLDDRRDELTILGADRAQQAFDISPMIDAPDDLALLARALSMRTFDASGVLVDLDSRGVGKLVAQVNAMPALNMVPTKQQTLLWHKLRLAAASADSRDRYSARFHRERIMAAEPAEPRWYLERADDRIAEGRPVDAVADYTKALDFGAAGWEPWVGRAIAHVFANESRQAAADFGHAIEVGDTDEATLLNHLLINAAIGDTRAFETSKARLIRVGPRPASGTLLRDRVMRALAIGVYVDPDCRDAVAFIREKGGETPVFGAADKYCAGDFEAARGTLEDTIRRDAGDKPSAEAFLLSMVYHHLGDTKAASRWLARGRQWRSEIPDQQRLAADHQLESLIQWHPSLSVTPTIELQALERAAETLTGGRGQTPDAPNRR